jgi:hypothetical protein
MDNKSKNLIGRVGKLIKLYHLSQYSSIQGLACDRYYYIQKKEELILLEEEVEKATERINVLNERIRITHLDVFLNWRNDFRILSRINTSQKEKNIDS